MKTAAVLLCAAALTAFLARREIAARREASRMNQLYRACLA